MPPDSGCGLPLRCAALLLCGLLCASCEERPTQPAAAAAASAQRQDNMSTNFVITLGQNGDLVVRESGLQVKRSRVSSALLYDASPDRVGKDVPVVIAIGAHRARMPPLDSVLFYDDTEQSHGVEQIDLHVRLPDPPDKTGDKAAREIYERALHEVVAGAIRSLNAAGWSRHIEPGNPRIQGKASYLDAWRTDPDPTYAFSLAEWPEVSATTRRWLWRVDGALAQLVFQPGRDGGHIHDSLSFKFSTERLYLSINDPKNEGDAAAGKIQLEKDMPALTQQRHLMEAKARAAGVPIMEHWIERPIGDLAANAQPADPQARRQ